MAETVETTSDQPHVAAIAFPFGSHAALMLNVTRRLAAAAPDVIFSFFSTEKSIKSLLGSSSNAATGFDNIRAYNVDDGIPENHVLSRNPLEELNFFIEAVPGNFNKPIEMAVSETNRKITCVMNDAFLWESGDIAEQLGVPWIPVWAPGASSLSCHLYTDLIRDTLNGGWEDDELSFLPGMPSSLRRCDLPAEVCENIDSLFSRLLHKAGTMLTRATVVVVNTFEELESTIVEDMKSKLKICLSIGPLTMASPSKSKVDDPYGCVEWLDSQEPASVAYVSFGTSATPPPHELVGLAQGLEEKGVPFLWSIKEGARVHLPEGFIERTSGKGMLVPWAPQSSILEHSAVGVFVTHCGWNSVLESIMCGVPLVYRPFFGDHMLIGRFVDHIWGIGVNAGDGVFTKDGTVKALDLILSQEEGKTIREKLAILKEQGREAIGPAGSSTNNFNILMNLISTT